MNLMLLGSRRRWTLACIALAALSCASAFAQHDERRGDARGLHRAPEWRFDGRYHHDHYYPPHGYVVGALPVGALSVAFGTGRFYFQGGVWFRPDRGRFVVVAPPMGIVVPVLPPAYATVWVGGVPYYYADDVYYTAAPNGGYVVAAPPATDAVATMPPPPPPRTSDGLYVYPRNGQDAPRTQQDRTDCGLWATGQTGYDPSMPPTPEVAPLRTEYLRAMTACLEARGYTVR